MRNPGLLFLFIVCSVVYARQANSLEFDWPKWIKPWQPPTGSPQPPPAGSTGSPLPSPVDATSPPPPLADAGSPPLPPPADAGSPPLPPPADAGFPLSPPADKGSPSLSPPVDAGSPSLSPPADAGSAPLPPPINAGSPLPPPTDAGSRPRLPKWLPKWVHPPTADEIAKCRSARDFNTKLKPCLDERSKQKKSEVSALGPACCSYIKGVVDGCYSRFPSKIQNRIYTPLVKQQCSQYH